MTYFSRRKFLVSSVAAALGLAYAELQEQGFDFVVMGDTHLDQMRHHDLDWLKENHEKLIPQMEYYSRFTKEFAPKLWGCIGDQLKADERAKFVIQLGDLVQGHAGSLELARLHRRDAIEFVKEQNYTVPFLHVKGNHDETEPESRQAYGEIIVPWINAELDKMTEATIIARPTPENASYAYRQANALFVYFDSFSDGVLDWLDEILALRTEQHLFFCLHRNVLVFGSRHSWNVYMDDPEKRARLLNLLGEHRAIVLAAHVHRYGAVVRQTERGPFIQFSVSSVLTEIPTKPSLIAAGADKYGPELTKLENNYKSDTKIEEFRQAQLAEEQPFITFFEYGRAEGYAILSIQGGDVIAKYFAGLQTAPCRTLNLTTVRDSARQCCATP